MTSPRKILIIRLSSIGDILLTTPVARALRKKFPGAEIHYVNKISFASLLKGNPNVDKVHVFKDDLSSTIAELKQEGFDLVIDLHSNIRSKLIRKALGVPYRAVSKYRARTWLYIKWRIGSLPQRHIVERNLDVVKPLGAEPEGSNLDFFISAEVQEKIDREVKETFSEPPVAVVLAATWFTKRWPKEYFVELLNQLEHPVILLGGKEETDDAAWLKNKLKIPLLNAVGEKSLEESAALMQASRYVITHDTGLMHIAAAIGKKIFSIWGHTVPALGFSPWNADSIIIENKSLKCRPCSKIGYSACPKGHFRCMKDLTPSMVLEIIRKNS